MLLSLLLCKKVASISCLNELCACIDGQILCREKDINEMPSSKSLLSVKDAEIIDLSNNHLDTLPANLFSEMKFLKILHLSNNSIENVDEACFNVSSKTRISPLRHIDLRGKPDIIA